MSRFLFRAGCALSILLLNSPSVFAQKTASVHADARSMTIAVADFTGADKELGRFIADSVLTDLAQSVSLSLVERTEIRQAFTELKLQSTGLTEPKTVKQLGKLVSADRLLVGSFLLRDNTIFVNARLLDVRTGKLAQGGAASVSAPKEDLLSLSHKLAKLFHKRLTGTELRLDEEPDIRNVPRPDIASVGGRRTENREQENAEGEIIENRKSKIENPNDPLASFREKGLIPADAKPNQVLAERDLAVLINRVMRATARQTENPLSVTQPKQPVSRLRSLAAFVKVLVRPSVVASFQNSDTDNLTPDARLIPHWGTSYVAAAIEQGLWNSAQPLRPRENATWAFVTAVLSQAGIVEDTTENPVSKRRVVEVEPDEGAYTGLIIDAGDLQLKRCMSPRILDETGRVIYPDQRHLPDYDFLLDNGMASYIASAHGSARAGSRPLIIRAIDVTGSLDGDLVVSSHAARKILAANERGRFLARWAVCFLVGHDQ
jgi:TolB-like protein